MAPIIATYSFRHNTIPEAVIMTKAQTRKGEILINDPPYDSKRSSDWYQELLIPYKMQGVTYAFMGPCPKAEYLPQKLDAFFPTSIFSKPINTEDKSLDLGFLKSAARPFRSAPPSIVANLEIYTKWLDRVQTVKGEAWKKQGIFDIIQISRKPIKCNAPMLLASIHFWESSTNTFQIPCGMITPTLFDVAAITGLKPIGQTYDPVKFKEQKSIFDTKSTSFSQVSLKSIWEKEM